MPPLLDLDNQAMSRKQLQQLVFSTAEAPRVNIAHGAVRSGKTVGYNVAYLNELANDPGGKGEYAIFGRTRETVGRNVLAPMMNPGEFGIYSQYVRYTPGAPTAQIFGKTVHIIGTSNALSEQVVRGLTLRKSLCDELSLFSEDTFNMIVSRHSVKGAWIGGTTNPDHPRHWLKTEYIDRPELGHYSIHFSLRDNESHLPEGYIPQLEAQYSGTWKKRFISGLWVAAEGAIYEEWDENENVIAHRDIPPIVYLVGVGIDYGDTNPTVGVLLGVGEDKKLYVLDEWVPKRGAPSERTKSLDEWLQKGSYTKPNGSKGSYTEIDYIFVDPAAGAFKSQMVNDGFSNGFNAVNDVNDGLLLVSSLLATRQLYISDRCSMLREEFPSYVWDLKATERGEDKPLKENDHAMDALRYVVLSGQPVWRPWVPNLYEIQRSAVQRLEAFGNAAA